jgi:hypothetical protein
MPAVGYDDVGAQASADLGTENQPPAEEQQPEGEQESQQQQTQQVQGQQTQDPNFNPSQWQLKFRDRVITPKDRQHLVNLAQQGYSYSQRMQELNQKEQELKGMAERYSQYDRLSDAFQKNPKFKEQIFKLYQESDQIQAPQAQPGQPQAQQGAVPEPIIKELNELRQWRQSIDGYFQTQQERQAEEEVNKEIETLKGKYQRQDWDVPNQEGITLTQEIVRHSLNNGSMPLDRAYRDLMYDRVQTNTQAETLKQAATQQVKQKKAGVVAAPGGKPAAAGGSVNAKASYDQLAQQALKDMGIN